MEAKGDTAAISMYMTSTHPSIVTHWKSVIHAQPIESKETVPCTWHALGCRRMYIRGAACGAVASNALSCGLSCIVRSGQAVHLTYLRTELLLTGFSP